MWDGDDSTSMEDETGEPTLTTPCVGFIGFRLIDLWVVKAGGGVERPGLAMGAAIPLSFSWWNWEEDPGDDPEIYDYMWGLNPDASGTMSGPSFISDWVGNPNTPGAFNSQNPGPFPFAMDQPMAIGQPAFDYRFFVSLGPVTLEDGDTLRIVGGWVIGEGLEGLRRIADLMLDAFYRSSIWGGGLGTGDDDPGAGDNLRILCASPNPASAAVTIGFSTPPGSIPALTIYDMSGRVAVASQPAGCGEGSLTLDLSGLPTGIYSVSLSSAFARDCSRLVVLR
jgi:hypothetical protein